MKILTVILIGLSATVLVACTQMWRNGGTAQVAEAAPNTLRVGTLNVHYTILSRDSGPWSVGDWNRRKGPLDMAFKAMQSDVVAFQEMESFAFDAGRDTNLGLDWLIQQNPDFTAAATGDPEVFPTTQPIFYRTNRVRLLDQGWFFFSDTPDVIYARTYNGGWSAFATWAQLEDRTTRAKFRVVNIHTDYASKSNRLKSAELVAQRITPWVEAGENVFVVGDFNARRGDDTLAIVERAGITFPKIQGSTYHFNRGLNLFGAIDHLGHTPTIALVGQPVVIRQKFGGEWPTDHYPVLGDFKVGP